MFVSWSSDAAITKKKTALQHALDAVDSAYSAAFPDGVPREEPLSKRVHYYLVPGYLSTVSAQGTSGHRQGIGGVGQVLSYSDVRCGWCVSRNAICFCLISHPHLGSSTPSKIKGKGNGKDTGDSTSLTTPADKKGKGKAKYPGTLLVV